MLCHYSYFSQQEDSLHIIIFQNIWIHLLIPIDELHQPLQLLNELLAQPLVLNVTSEVNPVTEKRPALALLWVTLDHPNQISQKSQNILNWKGSSRIIKSNS